jgi:putative endonuclease
MYFVYILYSQTLQRYYIGQTSDLATRLIRHNSGHGKFTKKGVPWRVVWKKEVSNRSEAVLLEKQIKGRGAQRFIDEQ